MISQLHYTPTDLPPPETLSNPGLPHPTSPTVSPFQKPSDFHSAASFPLPAQTEGTLLTPASTTQSPQTRDSAKFSTPYPTPPSCATALLQDTTSTGRMYSQWNSAFDLNASTSQASSPMTTQPFIGQDSLETYAHGHDGRRTPGPPEHSYMGHFGVTDSHSLGHGGPSSYYMGLPSVDQHGNHPTMMRGSAQGIPDSRGVTRTVPSGSLIGHPSHALRDERRDSLTDLAYPSRSINGSPRGVGGPPVGRVRKAKRVRRQVPGPTKDTSQESEALGEYMNCRGQEVPPTLKPTCPEEERCIFDSRWRHRKDKGQTMWDGIQEDYQQHFGRTPPGKETLQMKFKRARSKYIEWLPEDVEIMRSAWKEMEDERYETLLQKFLKKGGSRNMLLNATDVEVKVVNDMKLEEGMYMHAFKESLGMDIRRRQKANPPKKRSSTRSTSQSQHGGVITKIEADEESFMVTQGEDEIIDQVHGARRNHDKFAESGSEPQMVGRWGPGASILGAPMWDSRQSVNNIMPPMADQLLGQGTGSGLHRR